MKLLAKIIGLFVLAAVISGGWQAVSGGKSTQFASSTPVSSSASTDQGGDRRAWNAAVGVSLLKKSLNDPDSLFVDHVSVNDAKVVCIEYRAKNGFGGVIRNFATINLAAGKVSGDAGYWNKFCAKGDFYDETTAASWDQSLADAALTGN